jgi:predicted DNA-binding ribbon-helix-helix protein
MRHRMEKHRSLELKKRNLKLKGKNTSVRLEEAFWLVIDGWAKERAIRWEKLVADALEKCPSEINRSSWLRVWCLGLMMAHLRRAREQIRT